MKYERAICSSKIVEEIVESTAGNYLEYEVEDILEHLAVVLQKHLKARKAVRVKGLGVISVRDYERKWKNPRTQEYGIVSTTALCIRMATELKHLLKIKPKRTRKNKNV